MCSYSNNGSKSFENKYYVGKIIFYCLIGNSHYVVLVFVLALGFFAIELVWDNHLNWKNVLLTYFCLIEGEPGKGQCWRDIARCRHSWWPSQYGHSNPGRKFTMWMCLCNQHNNFVLCVKHIFLSLNYRSCVVWFTSEIYPWR